MQYQVYSVIFLMSFLVSQAMEDHTDDQKEIKYNFGSLILRGGHDQKEIQYNPHDLMIYARDNNISLSQQHDIIKHKNMQQYKTLNQYGFCINPNDPISSSFVSDIIEHSKFNSKTHVLEIGCGMGFLAKKVFLSSTMDNDFKYVAMDLDKNHLAIATQEVQKNIFSHYLSQVWYPVQAQFLEGNLNKTFTHIGAFNMHSFFTPRECIQSLQKIESLLDENGKAYIYTPHPRTHLYGSLIPFLYGVRTLYKKYPGYIENMPETVKKGKKLGLISKRDIKDSGVEEQAVSHCLFLKTEELRDLIRKHTSLKIERFCTINEYQGNKKLVYSSIIVTKPKQL